MNEKDVTNARHEHAPGSLAFVPKCARCACKEWRYGFIFVDGVRIARKLCAKCDVPWALPFEVEGNELHVPDPVLVLDYTRPLRPRLIEAAHRPVPYSPQMSLFS